MNPIFYILFSEPKEINLYKYNPNLFTNNNSENKNFIQSKRGREKKKIKKCIRMILMIILEERLKLIFLILLFIM